MGGSGSGLSCQGANGGGSWPREWIIADQWTFVKTTFWTLVAYCRMFEPRSHEATKDTKEVSR
jgi:hypothetical protein